MTAADAARLAESRMNGQTDSEAAERFPVRWFSAAAKIAVTHWVIKGLAERGSMGAIYGASGSGKSFFAIDLALANARAETWMGRRVRGAASLYIAAEAGGSIRKRVLAYQIEFGLDDADLPFGHIEAAPDLLLDDDVSELIIAANRFKETAVADHVVIFVDTLSRAMAGDDGSGQDMPKFVRACDCIRAATGCTLVIVHHVGHGETHRARGHSSFRAALDWEIFVEGTDGTRTVTVTKVRDGISGDRLAFNLRVVELGTDEDGDAETSCVVEPADAPERAKAGDRPITGHAGLALKMLHRAIDEVGQVPPASNHVPQGIKAVSVALWRSYCYQGAHDGEDSPEARKKAFQRSRVNLQNRGAIGIWTDWAWIAEANGTGGTPL